MSRKKRLGSLRDVGRQAGIFRLGYFVLVLAEKRVRAFAETTYVAEFDIDAILPTDIIPSQLESSASLAKLLGRAECEGLREYMLLRV